MNENTNQPRESIEYDPVATSHEPISLVDATLLMQLDDILSPQIPVRVETPDGKKVPFEEYDEPLHRDGEVSLLADDDGDLTRPKTRAALEEIAAEGTINEDEIEDVLDQLLEMGGRTDSTVLLNICKVDWGSSS